MGTTFKGLSRPIIVSFYHRPIDLLSFDLLKNSLSLKKNSSYFVLHELLRWLDHPHFPFPEDSRWSRLWRTDCVPFIPARYVIAVVGCLGFVNVYGLRVNLSVAIVQMVNSTATFRNGSARVGLKQHDLWQKLLAAFIFVSPSTGTRKSKVIMLWEPYLPFIDTTQ